MAKFRPNNSYYKNADAMLSGLKWRKRFKISIIINIILITYIIITGIL